jgi:cellobiose-specific phosphotransferase system component IIB
LSAPGFFKVQLSKRSSMSIITVLKEADTLIFSTDSRMMMHDFSGVATDAEQKIFEIAPNTFIATSGRKLASQFQIARARELAVELGTTDIQAIGAGAGAGITSLPDDASGTLTPGTG